MLGDIKHALIELEHTFLLRIPIFSHIGNWYSANVLVLKQRCSAADETNSEKNVVQ